MIIDAILDRKEGSTYTDRIKQYMLEEAEHFEFTELAKALKHGTSRAIADELCIYIIRQDYNPSLCSYIKSVQW